MLFLNCCKHGKRNWTIRDSSKLYSWIWQKHMIVYLMIYYLLNNDLFFVIRKYDICNFADDNTLYSCGATFKTVLENLKHDAGKLLYWFKKNSMKANSKKFQFMILSKTSYKRQKLSVSTFTIDEFDEVQLLGWPLIKS